MMGEGTLGGNWTGRKVGEYCSSIQENSRVCIYCMQLIVQTDGSDSGHGFVAFKRMWHVKW